MQIEYPFLRYNLFFYAYVLSFYDAATSDRRFRQVLRALESKLVDGNVVVESPNRGLAGLSVNDITLRGLVSVDDEYLAVFEAPDSKTYILRGGERLFDGSVKTVTHDAVVFLAEVRDPQSLVSEREVRRTLGGTESAR